MSLGALPPQRRDYSTAALDEASFPDDPFVAFDLWLSEAVASPAVDEAYAMTLATATATGMPSARVVLLRGRDSGLVFFTNYEGRKGRELTGNPRAAVVFYWGPLERQIRVEGAVERVSDAESDAYFASRPHYSKLGAQISHQSSVLSSRAELESRLAEFEVAYPEGSDVPRPGNWGGFRLVPMSMEFWQGRRNRLHDRLRFRRFSVDSPWLRERLAP